MTTSRPPEPDAATATPDSLAYELTVNGRDHSVPSAWLGESLLYVLRERLGLPGTQERLRPGRVRVVLGAARRRPGVLVLRAGRRRRRRRITTVEGVAAEGELSDVQQAFLDEGAVQCGFCIPGPDRRGPRPARP